MSSRYEVVVDDDTYELFRNALSLSLTQAGFETGVRIVGMESPSVTGFRKGEDVITMEAAEAEGGDFRIVVESGTLDVQRLVLEVIENAALHMISVLARSLDEPSREALAEDLQELLQSIPPGEEPAEQES
jgi:hypothetical protein